MNEGKLVGGEPVVARRHPTTLFDPVEEPRPGCEHGKEGWPIATLAVRGLRAAADINLPTIPDETVENDPGCVKTPLLCYDSLVILRENLMRRFVEQADRGQWTL